eukprot:CAMPEP_0179068588 /NCGR_PEP_ID=MMETSP0796-20121207/30076_1 /TAXON_ID=73915 /ORGANISM="Pyrodinium bahamense, Strain pbaha01" /LENGTH=50 /DNA_ID=CAMNT_0020765641 /DNA_START=249 /DNA_END=401 /DNA_ORIENTATION=-
MPPVVHPLINIQAAGRQEAVAENDVITGQVLSSQLKLQIVVGLEGLRHQN